jgi:16S rRNA (guanine527-N7)-methyltransferase
MTYEELKAALGDKVVLSDETLAKLHSYATLLKEWNEKMNLTSIVEEPEVIEKHFYDCLIPAKVLSFSGKTVVDFGTGAGFPGLVWAICFPESKVTLIEATGKKCTFLQEVINQNKLINVRIYNQRAEEFKQREYYDVVAARAVAPLPILLEVAAPLAKVGGVFIAMKSAKGAEELKASSGAMKSLHLVLSDTQSDSLPSGDGVRLNYFFTKKAPTEKKYPRKWADIEKKPLA